MNLKIQGTASSFQNTVRIQSVPSVPVAVSIQRMDILAVHISFVVSAYEGRARQ